jgi:hypothetical protein
MPRRRRTQGEAISQALGIAGQIFGLKQAFDAKARAEQEFKLGQEVKGKQLEALGREEREAEALARGELTPTQRQSLLLKGFQFREAERDAPGAFAITAPVTDERTGEVLGSKPVKFVRPVSPGEIRAEVEELKIAGMKEKKVSEKAEKGVMKISDKFEKSGIPEILPALERIDELLISAGLPQGIDTVDPKKDVPGFGRAAGLLPDILVTRAGEDLRQDVNSLVNILLKARSGGAVTPQEASRLAAELKGANTDRALVRGLRNLKSTLDQKMKNTLAGVSVDSKNLYTERNPGVIDSSIFAVREAPKEMVAERRSERRASPLVGVTNLIDELIGQREAVGQVDQPFPR